MRSPCGFYHFDSSIHPRMLWDTSSAMFPEVIGWLCPSSTGSRITPCDPKPSGSPLRDLQGRLQPALWVASKASTPYTQSCADQLLIWAVTEPAHQPGQSRPASGVLSCMHWWGQAKAQLGLPSPMRLPDHYITYSTLMLQFMRSITVFSALLNVLRSSCPYIIMILVNRSCYSKVVGTTLTNH